MPTSRQNRTNRSRRRDRRKKPFRLEEWLIVTLGFISAALLLLLYVLLILSDTPYFKTNFH